MQFFKRHNLWIYIALIILLGNISHVQGQPGEIIEFGDQVLDPNSDGFVSISPLGFNIDNYDVDEFELKMFGVPIFGDGEALNDVQSGQPCGVVDITLDSAGYGIYAGYDNNENLIFRFRLAGDRKSVQSYTIFMDTDQLVGANDPNSSAVNPGFEIEITLIQRFGVYIYDIDGTDACPTPLRSYSVDTHQQKSTSSRQSCGDTDYYLDFYVPFSDLTELFGITPDTNVRFAGVTNISATCALDGSISDIGGVDDIAYDGCFSCAILDLTENQCPSSVSNLCDTCAGFPLGATQTPTIDLPVIVGDENISGSSEADAEIFVSLYSALGDLLDQDTIISDPTGFWASTNFINPLNFGDSVVVNALLPGKCESGALDTGLSFAIVSPNQPPTVTGPGISTTYIENAPPVLFAEEIIVSDDNTILEGASVKIISNYEFDLDVLNASPPDGITFTFNPNSATMDFVGTASLDNYQLALRSITFQNLSEAPALDIRQISFEVFDGTNISQPYVSNILITAQNDPPSIVVGGTEVDTLYFSTLEDVPLSICIEAQDVDLDQIAIDAFALANTAGQIVEQDGLCLLFEPNQNYNGQEFIEITVCDDGNPALCDVVVAAIEVIPVNDPPQVINEGVVVDSVFYTIEQATSLEFCLNGFDIEDDEIILESVEELTTNSSTFEWQSELCFSYTPDPVFTGIEKLKITVCDTGSPSRCSLVYVEIEVADINLPPEITTTNADTLYIEMFQNTTKEICIDAVDPDNDELDFGELSDLLSIGGTSEISYSCLSYSPPNDYVGTVLLDVTVCDDVTPPKCDALVLKINVLPFNNPPQVVKETIPVDTVFFDTDENVPIEVCLEVIDPDNDAVVTTEVVINSGNGTFDVDGSLCILFSPEPNEIGDVYGTVTICDDGDPSKCSETVIAINISPLNDPPEILLNGNSVDTLYFETFRNVEFDFCLEATDINDDLLIFDGIKEINGGGFYQPAVGDLCFGFVPENNFVGKVLHLLTICDNGDPIGCDSVYVSVDVLMPNRPPRLFYNSVETDTIHVVTNENEQVEVCVVATDDDGNNVFLSDLVLISGEGSTSFIQDNNQFCFQYSPTLGFFGNSYWGLNFCDDGQPSQCAEIVLHIEVANVNSPPEVYQNGAVLDTLRFSTPVRTMLRECIEAIDKDGDLLNLSTPNTSLANGLVSADGDGLCLSYSPQDNFLGLDYFSIEVCDDRDPALCVSVVVEIDVYTENTAPRIFYNGEEYDTIAISTVEKTESSLLFEVQDNTIEQLILSTASIVEGSGELVAGIESGLITANYTPDILSKGGHEINLEVCDDGLPVLCDQLVVQVTVSEQEIFPFEAISPNNDNLNDYWVIQGIEHYPNNSVRIFDRWNNLVFEMDQYNNNDQVWRGESNRGISKSSLNDGTYFYKITLAPGADIIGGAVVLKK